MTYALLLIARRQRQRKNQCRSLRVSAEAGTGAADLGETGRIGAPAPACEGRAGDGEGHGAIELGGGEARERTGADPAHGAQGEQKRRLEAVAGPNRVHDLGWRGLDFDGACLPVPSLRAATAAGDDEKLR